MPKVLCFKNSAKKAHLILGVTQAEFLNFTIYFYWKWSDLKIGDCVKMCKSCFKQRLALLIIYMVHKSTLLIAIVLQ
jgi:hypothetical protein